MMDWFTFRCARRLIRAEQQQHAALRIIEVGSYIVTTRYSRIRRAVGLVPDEHRQLLRPADTLLGVDAVDGPGVDLVAHAERLPLDTGSYDLGLCSSVLEHCADPVPVLRELLRVARRAIVIIPWRYFYHAVPGHYEDYWRASPAGLAVWAAQAGGVVEQSGWAGPHTWAVLAGLSERKDVDVNGGTW